MNTNKPISDAGIFLWMTWQAMQQAGLDTARIFASVNLPDSPPDPTSRRDNSTQARFWRQAEQISQNPDVGLIVGGLMPPFRGQVFEYLFLSSPTFGDGLTRSLRYMSLLTDALPLQLRIDGNTAILAGFEHPVRHYLECALSVFLSFLRHVSDGAWQPTAIWFTHTQGATPEQYQQVYGVPVLLGMPEGGIHFALDDLYRPSPAAEPTLLRVHEALIEQRLAELARYDVIYRIERVLAGLLELGEVRLEHVAGPLQRSPRQLRAELAAIGSNFNDVVAHYRERLARRLLSRTNESIDQIVYLTGFSEPSAFNRAFKRWTGETPMAYRRRKQSDINLD